jgi:hypothetical protein
MPLFLTLDETCRHQLCASDRLSSAQLLIRCSPNASVRHASPHTRILLQQQVGSRRVWSKRGSLGSQGSGCGSTDATICGMPRCPLTVAAKRSWSKCHCFDWGRPRMARTATRWAGSESVLRSTSGCPCACAVGWHGLAGRPSPWTATAGPAPQGQVAPAGERNVVAPVARLLDDPSGCPLASRLVLASRSVNGTE